MNEKSATIHCARPGPNAVQMARWAFYGDMAPGSIPVSKPSPKELRMADRSLGMGARRAGYTGDACGVLA